MKIWRWDLAEEGYFTEPNDLEVPDWYNEQDVAETAAEKYHAENDGWEDEWPVAFKIYPPDSEDFTTIRVDREYEPMFSAYYSRDAE